MNKFVLAIDQGTTSCRAIIYNELFEIVSQVQKEFTQFFPNEGWVEHKAEEIWECQLFCIQEAIKLAKILPNQLIRVGITNQRETIVAWDKLSSKPISRAIVWQDRRTADACEIDKKNFDQKMLQSITGLNFDAYFSASKIRWILNEIPKANVLITKNQLCIGTIDSWLLFKLTNGQVFATDVSNASRTNLFNIKDLKWDQALLNYFQIPITILPEVKPSHSYFGDVNLNKIALNSQIYGIIGDQQASLFGHQCFEPGMIKNTFGTGCFILQNIGTTPSLSQSGLLTTIAWKINNEVVYALEGAVFNAGSVLKWLKENLNIFENYQDIDQLCLESKDSDSLVFVPALTGLGAPYWDMFARGMMIGLNRNTSKADILKASLESIAFQTKDLIDVMEQESKTKITKMLVDGGLTASNYFLQLLADILQITIYKNHSQECSALGAAMMAVQDLKAFKAPNQFEIILPKMKKEVRDHKYKLWENAVRRSMKWIQEENS